MSSSLFKKKFNWICQVLHVLQLFTVVYTSIARAQVDKDPSKTLEWTIVDQKSTTQHGRKPLKKPKAVSQTKSCLADHDCLVKCSALECCKKDTLRTTTSPFHCPLLVCVENGALTFSTPEYGKQYGGTVCPFRGL